MKINMPVFSKEEGAACPGEKGKRGGGEERMSHFHLTPSMLNSALHLLKRRTRNPTPPGRTNFALVVKIWKMGVGTAGIFVNSEWQFKLYSLSHYFMNTYMSTSICTHKETYFQRWDQAEPLHSCTTTESSEHHAVTLLRGRPEPWEKRNGFRHFTLFWKEASLKVRKPQRESQNCNPLPYPREPRKSSLSSEQPVGPFQMAFGSSNGLGSTIV